MALRGTTDELGLVHCHAVAQHSAALLASVGDPTYATLRERLTELLQREPKEQDEWRPAAEAAEQKRSTGCLCTLHRQGMFAAECVCVRPPTPTYPVTHTHTHTLK